MSEYKKSVDNAFIDDMFLGKKCGRAKITPNDKFEHDKVRIKDLFFHYEWFPEINLINKLTQCLMFCPPSSLRGALKVN